MIIQVRGTSGSGKTWVVKEIFRRLGPFEGEFIKGRKQPLFYSNKEDIVILGQYESVCGGCDSIRKVTDVMDLIEKLVDRSFYGKQRVIICEGLMLSEDVKWSSTLMHPLKIAYLTTHEDQCVAQTLKRRHDAGNFKEFNDKRTRYRAKSIARTRQRMIDAGAICRRCTSTQAPGIIINWIKEFRNEG